MSNALVLGLVALLLALVEEFQSEGKSILGYAVIFLALIPILSALHV